MKYRKKPVEIEAYQLTKERFNYLVDAEFPHDIPKWFQDSFDKKWYVKDIDFIYIITLEGEHKASIDDWIVKGIKGELYPLKPNIFDLIYEKVEEWLKKESDSEEEIWKQKK